MGCCCSIENIGVYVRNTHWAHALVQQTADLSEAVMRDDDVTLQRLLDVGGGNVDTHNQDGHTLLGIALRQNKPLCRALLESRGARIDKSYRPRKLPELPGVARSAYPADELGDDGKARKGESTDNGTNEETRSG